MKTKYIIGLLLLSILVIMGWYKINTVVNTFGALQLYGNSQQYQAIMTLEKTHTRLIDRSKNKVIILEGDIFAIRELDDKLYIYGYQGYTIINLKTNQIYQYLMTWGPSVAGSGGSNQKELKELYKNKYILLPSFEDFADEEKELFKRLQKDVPSYPSQILVDHSLKIVKIPLYNENRLIDAKTGALLEPDIKYYEEIDNKVYLLGEYSYIVVEKNPYHIKQFLNQERFKKTDFFNFSTYKKSLKEKITYYTPLKNKKDFSDKEINFFDELETKSSKENKPRLSLVK